MERTTISLPRELIIKLRIMAAERRTSMAAIIREAVEEKTAEAHRRSAEKRRPLPTVVGMADSGYTDTSLLASEGPVPPVSWR